MPERVPPDFIDEARAMHDAAPALAQLNWAGPRQNTRIWDFNAAELLLVERVPNGGSACASLELSESQ